MRLLQVFWVLLFFVSPLWGKGILCLTFDDRHFESWLYAASLIESYGGRATFFPSGHLTSTDLEVLVTLSKRGHSIGSHSVSHKSVPEQCSNWIRRFFFLKNEIMPHVDICSAHNIDLNCFAYPFGIHSEESDRLLLKQFKRLRVVLRPNLIHTTDKLFVPVDTLKHTVVYPSVGIGEYYGTDVTDLRLALQRCHEENACLILFTHGVYESATGTDCNISLLENILELAKSFDVTIIGMDGL